MTAKDEDKKVIVVGSGCSGTLFKKIALACQDAGIHVTEAHKVVTPAEHIKPIIIESEIRNEQKVLNPEGSKFIKRKRKA